MESGNTNWTMQRVSGYANNGLERKGVAQKR